MQRLETAVLEQKASKRTMFQEEVRGTTTTLRELKTACDSYRTGAVDGDDCSTAMKSFFEEVKFIDDCVDGHMKELEHIRGQLEAIKKGGKKSD